MPLTIGREELVLAVAAAGASAALMTAVGRWTGWRACRREQEKRRAIEEAQETTAIRAVKQELDDHLKQVAPMVDDFQQTKRIVAETAVNVQHLAESVHELKEIQHEHARETREINRTLRDLLLRGNLSTEGG